jgi:hypothetical protein
MGLMLGCGPSREELKVTEAQKRNLKYKVGQVVYLKPDSCKSLIVGTDIQFLNERWDSCVSVYEVRDCHGLNTFMQEAFIYGVAK